MTNTTRTDLINYLRNNNIKYEFKRSSKFERIIIDVEVTKETNEEIKENLELLEILEKQLLNK